MYILISKLGPDENVVVIINITEITNRSTVLLRHLQQLIISNLFIT